MASYLTENESSAFSIIEEELFGAMKEPNECLNSYKIIQNYELSEEVEEQLKMNFEINFSKSYYDLGKRIF